MHPPVVLKDAQGDSVAESGGPVSPMVTCDGCHDTAYIRRHTTHAPAHLGLPHDLADLLGEGVLALPAPPTELNCFLCHIDAPPDGTLRVATADSKHCANCHGLGGTPLRNEGRDGQRENPLPPRPSYLGDVPPDETTGVIFSSQMIAHSTFNLADKQRLARPWDVHAARMVGCTDCHPSSSNPACRRPSDESALTHLTFDPRREPIADYLTRPDHRLARDSMRGCDDCHDATAAHDWLPQAERHFQRLACQACHIPHVPAAAWRQVDATVLLPDAGARIEYRGVQGDPANASSLVDGYRPVLLARPDDAGGPSRLFPHNLVACWQWVHGEPGRPVSLALLRQALFEGDRYHPDIVEVLDVDDNGRIEAEEARLDTTPKVDAVRKRLEAVGVVDARIRGEIRPFPLHHGVVGHDWATRDCDDCHARDSRIDRPIQLASYLPGDVMPRLRGGRLELADDGTVWYHPASSAMEVYLPGHDRSGLLDLAGAAMVLAMFCGVITHGVLRWRVQRQVRREVDA